MAQHPSWWQTNVIYQIYPRSFQDENGDGIGDLPGILSRLDYLRWLGIDAIWLSPIYPSPMADFGYDISDYTNTHPLFGTLADMDKLIEEAHKRDLKLILDYVPNHTSDEHPWFQQSRASRSNPRRSWYLWSDSAPDGGPPNNWAGFFGGSAWQWDTKTEQYYLHMFDAKQPDLNWRNPEVRSAMYDVLRFWLDRGIDGFRVDALWMLLKDEQLRDNPARTVWGPCDLLNKLQEGQYTEDQPGIHAIVREIRSVLDKYKERVFIGEVYLPVHRLVAYYGEMLDGAHLPLNCQFATNRVWEAQAIKQIIEEYEAALPAQAWPNWVLGNHDMPRIASRVGREQARIAQMLLLTLRGTPTCYYGDELGMEDVDIPPSLRHDPQAKYDPDNTRDRERTPMQWTKGPNAGFSIPGSHLWLPIAPDYQTANVESQSQDPHSILMLTRALLTLRRSSSSLTLGSYRTLAQENINCLAYLREHEHQRYLITLNFTDTGQTVHMPLEESGSILLSTQMDRVGNCNLSAFNLRAHEGCLIELS
ncbi:alpha-amylase family glycosyl hydrolase [Ktedonospora formicarum]|uniref:Alpha-amylase n=1 Tax=Ktedonospora formicarum TaxID=2778364 RepID=A0A8J3MPH1_9CHLR|nr:alpha-amylase family glycosyl hydrolase [Ktedonospora formicarum]GHO42910.1 alpha-amylase [Ktedonospora formicarum]